MPDLERAEKHLIIFLALTLFLGAGILLYLRSGPPEHVKIGRFPAGRPSAAPLTAPSAKIDINKATAEELMELKGIGPALARRIVEYRSSKGLFLMKEDIRRVEGIGPALYEKIKDGISVE